MYTQPTSLVTLLVIPLLLISLSGAHAGANFRKPTPYIDHSMGDALMGREVMVFDYAWRFYLGDIDGNYSCPADTFPENLTGIEVQGLHHTGATTLDQCRGDCCAEGDCEVWQWGGQPEEEHLGCWIGLHGEENKSPRWQGGGRNGTGPTPPPATSGPTTRNFDDSSWELVDAPHDGMIGGVFSQSASESHGYLPFNTTWYRKHFNLPAEWEGNSSIDVYFEGVFKGSSIYLNGMLVVQHESGYTSFVARLDNVSSLLYGDGKDNENVLAIHATATGGTGWWYEGGGLYRHVYLRRTPSQVHFVPDGLYAMNNVTGSVSMHDKSNPAAGMTASTAVVDPRVEVVHDGKSGEMGPLVVTFTILQDGKSVGTTKTDPFSLKPGATIIAAAPELELTNVELWSSARPYMYTLNTVMTIGADVHDNVSETWFGFRRAVWTADEGFFLNEQPFKWRGFCDHNDFAGVGTALSERINLFRAQSLRAVGGNSWRMSHNPPVPGLLDALDNVGVLVWDENRNFANETNDIIAQRDMVRRDRNHPSVMCWSFCNEGGCNKGAGTGAIFKRVSYEQDPMRPITANTQRFGPGDLSEVLDIQGFSHRPGSMFDDFHSKYPNIPTIGSECCSCRTQRGEDYGDNSQKLHPNFNGDCLQSQTGVEMSRKFISGILVWTLFDYIGEPSPYGWPHVSSSFGSLDLAGFAKAGAFYYRTWWLHNATNMSASVHDHIHAPPSLINPHEGPHSGRQVSAESDFIVHIVEHWQKDIGGPSRSIHAYTNAPMAELFVNGKSYGKVDIAWIGYATWDKVTYEDGNLTVTGINHAGAVVASHSMMTPGAPAKLTMALDAPSEATGTGTALVLDGHDTALVRVSLLDANGQVVLESGNNITFTVTSGPGKVIGVGNGDPQCHESNTASWRSTYHGLARVVIKVTEHHTTTVREHKRFMQVDAEGNQLTKIHGPGMRAHLDDGIVVEASTMINGKSMTESITIPVSADFEKHGVRTVARNWMARK